MIDKSLHTNKKDDNFYKNKHILITGGLGFIGSNLAIELSKLGANITIIDSLLPDYGGNLFNISSVKNKVVVNISDIRDCHSMRYLVKGKDILFNLAGTLSHVDSMKDPFTDLEINCVSQLSLLEVCRYNNPDIKIIYAGTRNQYGKPKYLPVNENHPLEPTDINGINCNAGEYYHILYNNIYNLRSCSLRLTNTFGSRHLMKHSRQGVLNWFLRQILDHEKIKLYGSGEQLRDINYIDDVVSAMLLVGASKNVWGQAYNLGGTAMSLKSFVEMSIEIYGKGNYEMVPFPDDRKKIEIGDYVADYSKLTRDVGWKPKVKIEDGIKKTLLFYEKNKKYYW